MVHKEISILFLLAMISAAAIASFISVKIYGRHDAPLEQFAENVLKDVTGITIDFTSENNKIDIH